MTELAVPQPSTRALRRRLTAEVWIVLGLGLGQSGVYAVLKFVILAWDQFSRGQAIASTTASINPARADRPYLDLLYQVLAIGFAIVPVFLALYLLSANGRSAVRRIGFDLARPIRDLGAGALLAVAIGVPGLVFYVAARALGLNVEVVAASIDDYWWAIPILILAAAKNGVVEEVIVVGYLMERLRDLGWKTPAIVTASALLRGSYHFYQGLGGFVGNVIMGVVFALYYRRKGRVMPLVVAHTLIDIVAFVGYAALPASVKTAYL